MTRTLVALGLTLCVAAAVAADSGSTFGSVQGTPISWGDAQQVALSSKQLELTQPGASIRSQPLPLSPLQRYRIEATMARGPGSTPRFAISYLDAQGKPIEWTPAWQTTAGTHANWLPLSPSPQRYVQGFVLPRGATQPRLVLRLDAGDKALARYARWTLSELRIAALGPVGCCERAGDNLLFSGDFEEALAARWSRVPEHNVELRALPGEPSRKHVVRVKPSTTAALFSGYLVPVISGRAYKLSLLARGQGQVSLDVHSLSSDRPTPLRVGNHSAGAAPLAVSSRTWQEVSIVWFAEAPNVALAEVVLAIDASNDGLEIDAVELRPLQ